MSEIKENGITIQTSCWWNQTPPKVVIWWFDGNMMDQEYSRIEVFRDIETYKEWLLKDKDPKHIEILYIDEKINVTNYFM